MALKARFAKLKDEHNPCPDIIKSLRVEMDEVKAAHAPCAGIIAELRAVPKAPPVICGVGMLLQSHDVSSTSSLLALLHMRKLATHTIHVVYLHSSGSLDH